MGKCGVPSDRTTVTELGTALGTLGLADVEHAVRSRTPVMRSLSPEMWERLAALWAGGAYMAEFHAAWANGRAFLDAEDGLRGRPPLVVEWKGTGRAPGDEVAPIDLRVDHVYLVSCKYLSKILFNTSPSHVFDGLLWGAPARPVRSTPRPDPTGAPGEPRSFDWYAEVAPAAHQDLYAVVRDAARREATSAEPRSSATPSTQRGTGEFPRARPGAVALPGMGPDLLGGAEPGQGPTTNGSRHGAHPGTSDAARHGAHRDHQMADHALLGTLPERALDLNSPEREALGHWLKAGWPPGAKERYRTLSQSVAEASAGRWQASLDAGGGRAEALLWRLLRIGSAPYFVLGSSDSRSIRLRIATSWDWRQQFQLASLEVEAQPGGQPRVGWEAVVRDRASHDRLRVSGHIEVRWSHGRFAGPPEAKGYLDTPHHLVPGYVTLR